MDSPDIGAGSGYGHIAIEVDDVYQATERIKAQGCKILRDAGPMNAGSTIADTLSIVVVVDALSQALPGRLRRDPAWGYRLAFMRLRLGRFLSTVIPPDFSRRPPSV